ncbi:hypothetical protein JHK87_004214 [Glycine soja]|nr:hypothetical protein JHK87_004214 [Glycine soja]
MAVRSNKMARNLKLSSWGHDPGHTHDKKLNKRIYDNRKRSCQERGDSAKQKEKDSPRSQHQNGEDLSCNTCWTDAECDDTQGSMEGVKVKQETNSIGEIVRTDESNLEEDVAVSRDYQGSSVEGEKDNEELESRSRSSQIEKLQEVVCVERGGSKEESPNVEAEDVKEIPRNVNKEPAQAS